MLVRLLFRLKACPLPTCCGLREITINPPRHVQVAYDPRTALSLAEIGF
jgi:hypothetical protein